MEHQKNEFLLQSMEEAAADPRNLGEMPDADAVGTAGSADCGDMLRMWVKFTTDHRGRRVIDRASFQSFGCQTAVAVASVATQLVKGRTAQEALALSGAELSAPLGPLPPMKIHCAQLVEEALRDALQGSHALPEPKTGAAGRCEAAEGDGSLMSSLAAGESTSGGRIKIRFLGPEGG